MVIYRHVFPKEVLPGSHHHFASNVKVAVLKLNRLIYSEASSVLYGEATFLATLQGNTLQYLCTTIEYQDDVLTQSMELPEYADRIRKVCVKVETAHDHFSEDLGLPCGDHSVFTQREVVRKFVDLLGGASRALQQMDVQYSLVPCGALRQEEALVSLFLAIAPLRDVQVCRTLESVDPPNTAFGFWQEAWEASNLSGDEYDQLQSACSKDWLRSAPPAVNKPATTPGQVDKIAALCASIGPKLRAVSKSKLRGCNHRWLCHYFGNCDIFWHLFRVAAEYADINLVEQIGAAVDGRWMYARQVHAEDLRGLGNTFPLPNIDRRIMREFAAADSTLLAYGPSPSSWTDLADIVGGIYNLQKVGTEVVEELLYVRFRKNGKEWVRLKTPGMMRELQFFKYLKESGM